MSYSSFATLAAATGLTNPWYGQPTTQETYLHVWCEDRIPHTLWARYFGHNVRSVRQRGTHLGDTKEVASMSFSPAPTSRSISSVFTSTGTCVSSFCSPSRGPTSYIPTAAGRLPDRKGMVPVPLAETVTARTDADLASAPISSRTPAEERAMQANTPVDRPGRMRGC
eukprot:CAMPEP_0177785068 /NCGR_PEP_ID=MMETSP0491_2-20121128/20083_1 /TAXON_ID=63592 /ORGANISM="Tetraselmis chuii, Strain PLY429" /LENGTH=167 /DNA_ID=CAMNT_0019305969 /DNA_START=113 /DNA_END=618 /DNA_ORIENTATION=-